MQRGPHIAALPVKKRAPATVSWLLALKRAQSTQPSTTYNLEITQLLMSHSS